MIVYHKGDYIISQILANWSYRYAVEKIEFPNNKIMLITNSYDDAKNKVDELVVVNTPKN